MKITSALSALAVSVMVYSSIILFPMQVLGCTNYLVTKGASADGSTLISYAADSHIRYGELYFRPAADYPNGNFITLRDRGSNKPLGTIEFLPHTYQVIGFMNEYQLAIGETTFDGRSELYDSTGIVDYGSLMFLALQGAKTAREAIAIIAGLVEKHGYASTGESFSIGDKNEVWIMEIIGKGTRLVMDKKSGQMVNADKGAVWVARRIPEGFISAHANQARITHFEKENRKTSISSRNLQLINNPDIEVVYAHDVISFARSKGYFTGSDKDFSFCDAYAPLGFEALRFCELRVWAMFNHASDTMQQYFEYASGNAGAKRLPLYIKPNRKLSAQDLMSFKRDHLEGTELDMAKEPGAEPFELPYRWRPLTWEYEGKEYFNERVTATQQTGFSFIAQMRSWLPDPVGGIFWFGVDDAASTVYMPFYCGIKRIPYCVAEGNGSMLEYSETAAFWVFNRVAHFAYLFYNRVMPDLKQLQLKLESGFAAETPTIDKQASDIWKTNPDAAREYITSYSSNTALATVDKWRKLGEFLLVKYLDGNVKQEKDGKFLKNPYDYPKSPAFPGYPDKWKKQVVDESGSKLQLPESQK